MSTSDSWLSHHVPAILASPAFTTQNPLLVVTWDEGEGVNNTVSTIFTGPAARQSYASSLVHSHYSLLHTMEKLWGLAPLTGHGRNSPIMGELLKWRPEGDCPYSRQVVFVVPPRPPGDIRSWREYAGMTVRQLSGGAMVYVSERDFAAATETAERLGLRAQSPESLGQAMLAQLPELLRADMAAIINLHVPSLGIGSFTRAPSGEMVRRDRGLPDLLRQHPILRHYAASTLRPHTVSDFLDLAAWTSTGIYDEVYRRLGTPFQLIIPLDVSARDGNIKLLSMTRALSDFTLRETDLARVLHGQIVALSQTARRSNASEAVASQDAGILHHLTNRERAVLQLMAQGRSNKAIASALFLDERTVEAYIRHIFQKLDLEPQPDDHRRVLAVLLHLGLTPAT